MRLYRTSRGRWVGTQAEARGLAGKDWAQVEVPTVKEGLLQFLNEMRTPAIQHHGSHQVSITPPIAPLPIATLPDAPAAPTRAEASNGTTLTDAEEFIQAADHPQLASLTENCIYRMRELLAAAGRQA